jgi:hypothetical protein
MTTPIFKAVPRSKQEIPAVETVVDETSALTQMLKEILEWFFSNKGRHRKLLNQCSFADGYSTDPEGGDLTQLPITIQPVATYQPRTNPSIVISVGPSQSKKAGLGLSLEHMKSASGLGKLVKRSFNTLNVKLLIESSSEQNTNRLARLLTDILFQHIPQYYQNAVMHELGHSQVVFPQDYQQPTSLSRDLQQDAQVERIYGYLLEFDVGYESLRMVDGGEPVRVVAKQGTKILQHDCQPTVRLGQVVVVRVKTNCQGIRMFTSAPHIFSMDSMNGPFGDGEDRVYRCQALRTGTFDLILMDGHGNNKQVSSHQVVF